MNRPEQDHDQKIVAIETKIRSFTGSSVVTSRDLIEVIEGAFEIWKRRSIEFRDHGVLEFKAKKLRLIVTAGLTLEDPQRQAMKDIVRILQDALEDPEQLIRLSIIMKSQEFMIGDEVLFEGRLPTLHELRAYYAALVFAMSGWNHTKASDKLGVARNTLYSMRDTDKTFRRFCDLFGQTFQT